MTTTPTLLNNAQRELHELAKRWWLYAKSLQAIVLTISIITLAWNDTAGAFAVVAGVITILSILTQWQSDSYKGKAQAIHRKFEFWDGLGWAISEREILNLHRDLPKPIRKQLEESPEAPFKYYDSEDPSGPKRLIENLSESAFWSTHLALLSAKIFGGISVGGIVLAMSMLLIGIQTTPGQQDGVIFAKVAVSMIVFLFSAGFVKSAYDFYVFSQATKDIETSACEMLKQAKINREGAIRLYHEYQISRAGAPLIPTMIYKAVKPELNKLWEQHRVP